MMQEREKGELLFCDKFIQDNGGQTLQQWTKFYRKILPETI